MEAENIITSRYVYDADGGVLINKNTLANVGHKKRNGYLRVDIAGKTYAVHRVCWFLYYGSWPEGDIDHINHDRKDNRLSNLRVVSRTENMKNATKSKANSSGHTGVTWCKQQSQWAAQVCVAGKNKKIGRFDSLEEAVLARNKANIDLGFHPNHGDDHA